MNNRAFYFRLAMSNIRKNRKFYAPYILTGIGTAAMFYIMVYLTSHKDLSKLPGAGSLAFFLVLGSVIIALFSAVFLFYTNSFLMKRRKKELGLYCVLGMEKRHLGQVQLHETLAVAFCSIAGGIACGILFSKLVLLLLCRIVRFQIPMGFTVSGIAAAATAAVFAAIFFVIFLFNLIHIARVSPVELLRESSYGQKEPKTKWLITVIGVLALGGGYAIALLVKSPLSAIFLFFVAVVLVITGTYCLFTSGSIAVLKLLRKNKRYYYRTNHFISISGMLYRMKQNAVGLANICILSTMVLVMVSTTVALNIGMEDILSLRYPADINIFYTAPGDGVAEAATERIRALADEQSIKITSIRREDSVSFLARVTNGGFETVGSGYASSDPNLVYFYFMTADDYERLTGERVSPGENELLAYPDGCALPDTFSLDGTAYTVTGTLNDYPVKSGISAYMGKACFFVAASETYAALGRVTAPESAIYVDMSGTSEEQSAFNSLVSSDLSENLCGSYVTEGGEPIQVTYESMRSECRADNAQQFYALYGGFLFLGLFLGLMFVMATILIIYYKQITEGYDDRERFRILQQVGMSEREVKTSIRSQVLTVFFLPLVTAAVHVAFAFSIITKLLAVLNLTNVPLYAWCTLGTLAVFALLYAAVYMLTAKVYYRIVRQ